MIQLSKEMVFSAGSDHDDLDWEMTRSRGSTLADLQGVGGCMIGGGRGGGGAFS